MHLALPTGVDGRVCLDESDYAGVPACAHGREPERERKAGRRRKAKRKGVDEEVASVEEGRAAAELATQHWKVDTTHADCLVAVAIRVRTLPLAET